MCEIVQIITKIPTETVYEICSKFKVWNLFKGTRMCEICWNLTAKTNMTNVVLALMIIKSISTKKCIYIYINLKAI